MLWLRMPSKRFCVWLRMLSNKRQTIKQATTLQRKKEKEREREREREKRFSFN